MIKYEVVNVNVDERKREIIEHLANAPGADVLCPQRDRVMIADLVIAGVEKLTASLNAHLEATAPALSTPDAVGALLLMQVMEFRMVMDGIARQIGMTHLNAILSDPEGTAMLAELIVDNPELAGIVAELLGREESSQ